MEDQIEDMPTPKPLKKIQKKAVVDVVDRGLECECDVTVGGCVDSHPRFIHSSQDRRRELFLRRRLWTLVPFMVSHHFFLTKRTPFCCSCYVLIGAWGTNVELFSSFFSHINRSFHSTEDRRIPEQFICFDCRVRADLSWELIKVDLYPKMMSKFKDLALFRSVTFLG